MSSANCSDGAGADSEGTSLVYMENSVGPSTEPCGTPQVHGTVLPSREPIGTR